tara:strand:+ start:10829 stop:11209 length:381 start_codon:yes stop_codon:yes gene_type:complete
MTTQQLREKIGAWLSDKTNHEGDLVDFLCDDCGVVIQEDEWEEKDCPIEDNNDDCSRCGIILTDDDMYSETGKCEDCLEQVEREKGKIKLVFSCDKCDKLNIRLLTQEQYDKSTKAEKLYCSDCVE